VFAIDNHLILPFKRDIIHQSYKCMLLGEFIRVAT